jgi:hypothetical protein
LSCGVNCVVAVDFTSIGANLALALERFTTPDATVGVFAAGTVPYYSGRPAIDFLGKMEPRIARLAPDLKDYWSPGVVLQPSRTTPKIVRPGHNKYASNTRSRN